MPVSKNALLRYKILDDLLKNKDRYTIKQLTERVNSEMEILETDKRSYTVTERMIRMDLENMMKVYSVAIVKNGPKYYYESKEESIDSINLREEDKTAINLALGVFSRFKNTPLYDKFSDVVTRVIASSLIRKVNHADTQHYIQLAEMSEHSGIEWIERIYQAMVEKKALVLHYRNFGDKTSQKVVSPYLLKEYRNKWYMIAYLHRDQTDNILIYKLSRIVDIQDTDEHYVEDKYFNGKKFFKYALGVFHRHASEPIDVKLKLRGDSIIKLFSEDKIHPTQEIIPISEKEAIMNLIVFDSPELHTLILSYSNSIEVLEPECLRKLIIDKIQMSLNQYL